MLRSIGELVGYTISATDGDIGQVDDFLFDDTSWIVRYLVADTGAWLARRRVLLSTVALGEADWSGHVFSVHLSKQQIEESPELDTEQPVSRQREEDLFSHYAWSPYWHTAAVGSGVGAAAVAEMVKGGRRQEEAGQARPGDPHLRSVKEVTGYRLLATDGEFGEVADFIVDDDQWRIQYMVVDTGDWLTSKQVLMAPTWVETVAWAQRRVHVDLTKATIEKSPEFDPSVPVNAEYELRLYDYYGRPRFDGR